jgi:hypothetical protein
VQGEEITLHGEREQDERNTCWNIFLFLLFDGNPPDDPGDQGISERELTWTN